MIDPRDDYQPRHAVADDMERINRMASAAIRDVTSPHSPRHSAEQVAA